MPHTPSDCLSHIPIPLLYNCSIPALHCCVAVPFQYQSCIASHSNTSIVQFNVSIIPFHCNISKYRSDNSLAIALTVLEWNSSSDILQVQRVFGVTILVTQVRPSLGYKLQSGKRVWCFWSLLSHGVGPYLMWRMVSFTLCRSLHSFMSSWWVSLRI